MSSLRNAVQRRNHRERAQPLEREKWGLLEKRKDYKLRAADHKLKKRKINALKQKASERNEDEFYFGMMSSTSEGGIKRSQRGQENSGGGGKVLSQDVVKLMKTQDRGYLQTMLQRTLKERERAERDVILGDTGISTTPRDGKIVFGEDADDHMAVPMAVEEVDDSDISGAESLNGQQTSIDTKSTPEEQSLRQQKTKAMDGKRRKLELLKEQEEKLSTALRELDNQRARMNGAGGGVNKNGIKFKQRQRKR